MNKLLLLTVTLLLTGTFLFAEEPPTPKKDDRIVVTEKVYSHELKTGDTVVYLYVNIAIGEVFILEFPRGLTLEGEVVIGDTAVLRMETAIDPLSVKVWALLFEGATELQMYGINSNVQMKLNAGITVIINFRIQPTEKASNRIIFKYPEWESKLSAQQGELASLKNKLQSEFTERQKALDKEVQVKIVEAVTIDFSNYYLCNTYSTRDEENLVFLRSDRICRLGKDLILVNFEVKNRYRQLFYLGDIKIYSLSNNGKVEVEDPFVHIDDHAIPFDTLVKGAIGFRLKESYSPNYIIEVNEEGGKKRVLELEVTF